MPSPIGHVIAGVTAGWLVSGAPPTGLRGALPPAGWREAALFGSLAALPDVDLLFGIHSGPTHSLGAAVLVGMGAFLIALGRGVSSPARLAVACTAAYVSHLLLDWLARDTTAPIGIMALWPFGREHYESDLHIFLAISRRYYQGWTFVRQNAIALVGELAILVPLLALVMKVRTRRRDVADAVRRARATRTPSR